MHTTTELGLAADSVRALQDLVHWIDERTHGMNIGGCQRTILTAGCFNVAVEHQGAITSLCIDGFRVSALTLLRPLYEATVRGMWLLYCATEKDLQNFEQGKLPKPFKKLVDAVEADCPPEKQMLSGIFAQGWKGLNGFTHTGMNMVSRQFAPGRLQANVSDAELCNAARVVGVLGMVAAFELVRIADGDNESLIESFSEKMAAFLSLAPAGACIDSQQ